LIHRVSAVMKHLPKCPNSTARAGRHYALPTYTALAVGVAAGLVMMRLWLGVEARVTCQNDTFVSDTWTRPIPVSPKP